MPRIIHLGLGPLGRQVVRFALERGLQVVAAVDPAEDKAGRDLGELCDVAPLGVRVEGDLQAALEPLEELPDVAVVTTVSSLVRFAPQALELTRAGLSIVSTCEELAFPWRTHPELAAEIDRVCTEHGVACLGTGVNPGYLMDFLPTVLTGACQRVDAVRVWRVQDASQRRIPFQQKIGAGLTVEQFREKQDAGTLRHVGLPESVAMIAHRLGWHLDRQTESLEPVIADNNIDCGFAPIARGMARGVEQIGRGFVEGREVITLHFRAAVGEPESYERVRIDGEPAIDSTIPGGVNGDTATCAIVVNAIRSLPATSPGLKTMCDIPPIAHWTT